MSESTINKDSTTDWNLEHGAGRIVNDQPNSTPAHQLLQHSNEKPQRRQLQSIIIELWILILDL